MIQTYTPSLQTGRTNSIHWNWVTLSGPDSVDFLHRLTTVNVRFLEVGQGAPGCFLTPLGKIRSYFTLWRSHPQELAFEFEAGLTGKWKSTLLALIDQYTFGEKIAVLDAGEKLECRWLFPETVETLGEAFQALKPGHTLSMSANTPPNMDEGVRLCHHGDMDFGRPWITAWGKPAHLSQWLDKTLPGQKSIGLETLEKWRIQKTRPRVDHEITEDHLPLEIGLRSSVAEQKGCYPGQEVIEKIIALGSPPRRLVRIEGTGVAPIEGSPILNLATPPVEVGKITSVVREENQFQALGMVKKIHAKEGLEVRFEGSASVAQGRVIQISTYE